MSNSWFKRWGGIGFVPISWQGWLATILTVVCAGPLIVLAVLLAPQNEFFFWLFGIAGIGIVGCFHLLVFWKTEQNYGN